MSGLPRMLAGYVRTKYLQRFSSREALLAWQDREVQRFVTKIRRRSRFYARQFEGYASLQWREFPIIDKAIMMANFDDLNTVGVTRERAFEVALASERSRDFSPTIGPVTVGLSSGTSGNRGLFVVDPGERHEWAGTVLAKMFPPLTSPQRVAFFLRANSNLYTTLGSRRIRFEYFDLLDPLEEHLRRLDALQPTLVFAPPSLLRLLARAIAEGKLHIHPEKIVSVAEVLDPLDEQYIRSQFGGLVHQVYQCTEGFLACTCRYGTLHLNEDVVAIQKEYLDRDLRKFVPIVTDFRRTAQPIIRYRLNDILTERASPCPCGSVFAALECIEGRCDDLLYLRTATGDRWIHVFPDFIRRAILDSSEKVEEYVAQQVEPDRLEIALALPEAHRPDAERAITASMHRLFEKLLCRQPTIRYVPMLARAPARKLKRVERLFPLDAVGVQ